eukprot:CAMPEP_0176432900 /NCGR_PEP_ID=MMETSP0127-20121128/15671_1 /TAXON_ID=938130 /ORGANISM="Platyophrya macrostoma, Strain WH" /LENGTH=240 /DNA_ID=CAMNT_0017815163 /DNA_START=61 /DNA_END=783 /DNA_ORIENTATION=+
MARSIGTFKVAVVLMSLMVFAVAADDMKEVERAAREIRDNSSEIISVKPEYNTFGWKLETKQATHTIYLKEDSENNLLWFRAEALVPGNPRPIADLINDPATRKKFDKSLQNVKVLSEVSHYAGESLRTAVDTYKVSTDSKPREFVYFSKTIKYEGGIVTIVNGHYQSSSVEESKSAVRGRLAQTFWEIRPIGKTQTNVLFMGALDAGLKGDANKKAVLNDFASVVEGLSKYLSSNSKEL